MSLADHIAVLNKGQLVQWGTPQELYATPKNTWLANFIGRGSVLNVEAVAPQQYINSADLHRLIAGYSPQKITSNVLVRPQDIAFVEASADVASSKPLAVTVRHCIFRGERYDIELILNNGQTLLAYSDVPMTLESVHHVRLGQAWSLESES
jgi:iron(III) transport system ATP-binding protein